MTLTEDEARKKWCPHAFTFGMLAHGHHQAANSFGPQNRGATMGGALDTCRCIASECMAFRWFDALSDDGSGCHMTPTRHVARHPDNSPAETRPLNERRGYCGLAGKP